MQVTGHTRLAAPLILAGQVLRVLSLLHLPPLLLALMEEGDHWSAFLAAAAVTQLVGLAAVSLRRGGEFTLSIRQMFLATTLSWLAIIAFASLPFIYGPVHLSVTDAVFETVSGVTTTGATVLVGLDHLPHSILLWRGLLQWLGGIGIVVLAIAILPFLSVGGMRLFRTESSDWSGKSLPRLAEMIRYTQFIYITFTLAALLAYRAAGMSWFDAAIHAMTSVSTGGYANYDASFGAYADRPGILWLGVLFMTMGALPFLLYMRALRGDRGALFRDQQVRGLLKILLALSLLVSAYQYVVGHRDFFVCLTQSTFNVVSIVTTTGYASEDYTQWGTFAVIAFFYMSFIGGCSGSTTGAIKMFRFQIAFATLRNQLLYMLHPRAVFFTRFNGEIVSDDIVRSLIAFSFFYGLTVAALAFCLSWLGLDFVTALSAAASSVGNVGPGLGAIVGPAGTFAPLPDAAKWLTAAGMLLGRLEILTLLIMFTPGFWRS